MTALALAPCSADRGGREAVDAFVGDDRAGKRGAGKIGIEERPSTRQRGSEGVKVSAGEFFRSGGDHSEALLASKR